MPAIQTANTSILALRLFTLEKVLNSSKKCPDKTRSSLHLSRELAQDVPEDDHRVSRGKKQQRMEQLTDGCHAWIIE